MPKLDMPALRERCIFCWAREIASYFPQNYNKRIAAKEMARNGYPKCKYNYTCKQDIQKIKDL